MSPMCFDSEYTMLHNYKFDDKQPLLELSLYEPVRLSTEKLCQLSEQHKRYIKQDVPHYTIPSFLPHTEDARADLPVLAGMQH